LPVEGAIEEGQSCPEDTILEAGKDRLNVGTGIVGVEVARYPKANLDLAALAFSCQIIHQVGSSHRES